MATPNLIALNNYIDQIKHKPFQWHTHDCFMFTNNAYKAMYGEGWADDWVGKYIDKNGIYLKRDALRKVFKANNLADAIDTKLTRIHYIPPRGGLVTTDKIIRKWVIGDALGISLGTKAIFLGEKGIVSIPISLIRNAWIKE